MPRQKRGSTILEKADKRSAAVRSINEKLDLGDGLTLENYNAQIEKVRSLIAEYNMTLSKLDRITNDVTEAEKSLRDLSELMLMRIATVFGKSSNEYEMAGGIRKSDRKRPVRRKATSSSAPSGETV